MLSATWATLTLAGVDELGRPLQIRQRCVLIEYADRQAMLVPWWSRWAVAAGAWPTSLN